MILLGTQIKELKNKEEHIPLFIMKAIAAIRLLLMALASQAAYLPKNEAA